MGSIFLLFLINTMLKVREMCQENGRNVVLEKSIKVNLKYFFPFACASDIHE